jgi:IS5 family transposase
MVRVQLIQQLFNLSDEQIEFQLPDRLSFQRFVGLRTNRTASRSGRSRNA